jgi:hypothetical protein
MINQQFEEALSKLEITQTKHKAELNEEYFINQENNFLEKKAGV